MLLQNPQLAYALLQAMVVMRIVDVQTACVSMPLATFKMIVYIQNLFASLYACEIYSEKKCVVNKSK